MTARQTVSLESSFSVLSTPIVMVLFPFRAVSRIISRRRADQNAAAYVRVILIFGSRVPLAVVV